MNESVWILVSEDGDGYWMFFEGVFKSTDSALDFAKNKTGREDLVLIQAETRDMNGVVGIAKDSYHLGYQNGQYFTTMFDLDKMEVQ